MATTRLGLGGPSAAYAGFVAKAAMVVVLAQTDVSASAVFSTAVSASSEPTTAVSASAVLTTAVTASVEGED